MFWIILITALRGQRHFWRNWAIVTAIFATIGVVYTIYKESSVEYLLVSVTLISLYALAIFGAVRGFLSIIKRAYWKEPANAK